jgi:hypothetical protein
MTAAGGDDPAAGHDDHAWDRLREQRAKDLGEQPPSEPDGQRAAADEGDEDEGLADDEQRESESGSDE